MVLLTAVPWGVSGREGSVLHFVPFWTSQPQQKSPAAPSPEMKSFNIQITPVKCHGKFDKNQEGIKPTLGKHGASQGKMKPKALSMLGGAGKGTITPETTV